MGYGMVKKFVTPAENLKNSFKLASKIIDSKYVPDIIVPIYRGGAPIGIAIDEFFRYKKLEVKNIIISSSSYFNGKQKRNVKFTGLDSLVSKINSKTEVLFIDDLYDTGNTLNTLIKKLNKKLEFKIKYRIAVVYYKPEKNLHNIVPDFYLQEIPGDSWIVFPHELETLTKSEIKKHRRI